MKPNTATLEHSEGAIVLKTFLAASPVQIIVLKQHVRVWLDGVQVGAGELCAPLGSLMLGGIRWYRSVEGTMYFNGPYFRETLSDLCLSFIYEANNAIRKGVAESGRILECPEDELAEV